MMWFEQLTGFAEQSPAQVRSCLGIEGEQLISRVNGRVLTWGSLEVPSLGELRRRVSALGKQDGKLRVQGITADVQHLHRDTTNADALFQVASQFNLLEMVSPRVTPERGVAIYQHDHTQGPACAIAAGAGTIYRNYFVPVNGQTGQSAANQVDCLADLGAALGNTDGKLWCMQNGYALATATGLAQIGERLRSADATARDQLRQLLRIGLQWRTQVTLANCRHLVSQAYCSALPVAYSGHSKSLWQEFARLVLEAAYEASLCAAILNRAENGSNRVFLTQLGGGAFGNDESWILEAMAFALNRYRLADLDVVIVSYHRPSAGLGDLLRQFSLRS